MLLLGRKTEFRLDERTFFLPQVIHVQTNVVKTGVFEGSGRFTRLTNGFSKKWENHQCALALWFAFYNFSRVHMTLKKKTPSMASGLADHVWTIRELIEESAKF